MVDSSNNVHPNRKGLQRIPGASISLCPLQRLLIRRYTPIVYLVVLLATGASQPAKAHDQSYGLARVVTVGQTFPHVVNKYNSYNDSGGEVVADRLSEGVYTVDFEGLSSLGINSSGHVQVNATGITTHHCKARDWISDRVTIHCFDHSGTPTDSSFTVVYLKPDQHADKYAFGLADAPSVSSYTPNPLFSHNAGTSDPVTATRTGVGRYSMQWANFIGGGSGGGNVQVSAYGPGSARCQVEQWGTDFANVRCFDALGAPTDTSYSVLYWIPRPFDRDVAFAWANDPDAPAIYDPDTHYAHNPANDRVFALNLASTGTYQVNWTRIGPTPTMRLPLVTTYGSSDVQCKAERSLSSSVNVICHDSSGNLANAQYSVLYLSPPKSLWTQDFSFADAYSPSTPNYSLSDDLYAFNRAGGAIEVTRLGLGRYQTEFERFDYFPGGGNVQVTAFGTKGDHCNIGGWSESGVEVYCFDSAGDPTDSAFEVLYFKTDDATLAVAYAWADRPTTPAYTPIDYYSKNPANDDVVAERFGPGDYRMTFQGFGDMQPGNGHVQVTAYGINQSVRCKVKIWGGHSVDIGCFDSSGTPTDTQYSVAYLRPDPDDAALAYAWTSDPTAPAYDASAGVGGPNTFNSGDGIIFATRHNTGSYSMRFDGFERQGIYGGHVQVVAYGDDDAYCGVEAWDTQSVDVSCYDSAGDPIDSRYNVLFLRPVEAPEPTVTVLLAAGILGLARLCRLRMTRTSPL